MATIVRRLWEKLLIGPEDISPLGDGFEVLGVFNPGVVKTPQGFLLLLRIAERPKGKKGILGLPRWQEGELAVDWVKDEEIEWIDPRVVRLKATGECRLTSVSYMRVARSGDGRQIDTLDGAPLLPRTEAEEYGIEDPRITPLNNAYYFTYVAVSRHGAATALASTADFIHFQRHGIIFPPENKDVLLFPQRIAGKYAALHRPHPATRFRAPEMWLAWSNDLMNWGAHEPLGFSPGQWESERVGGGAPPLATSQGWLAIYHGNCKPQKAGEVGKYAAGVLLLDQEKPSKILRRSRTPVLVAQARWEREGFVPDVVFPTAAVDCGETLLIYYGAADTYTAVVEIATTELMAALE